jgi:hypothetical protein
MIRRVLTSQTTGRQVIVGVQEAMDMGDLPREFDVSPRLLTLHRPLPALRVVRIIVVLMNDGHHPSEIDDGEME